MGVFDLRCGISGLSTTFWPPREPGGPRVTCSMFLLEDIAGVLSPLSPPVSGTYDRYGALELRDEDRGAYTRFFVERTRGLVDGRLLVSSQPDELKGPRTVEDYLRHAARTAYDGIDLRVEGRRVLACILLDPVADAILAADPEPVATLDDAFNATFPEEGGLGAQYLDPPVSALPQMRRFASVCRYAARKGGFRPIRREDAQQHRPEDVRAFAREAWTTDDGPIRAHIETCAPDWVAEWRKRV